LRTRSFADVEEFSIALNEVNGFVRNALADDLEIVAVIELIHRAAVCVGTRAASILVRLLTPALSFPLDGTR